MLSSRNNRPSADDGPIVISASTLKDAYRQVKARFGPEAVIIGSRNVTRRQKLGLGHEKVVEVTVQPPGSAPASPLGRRQGPTSPAAASTSGSGDAITREIEREVERIEELVRTIVDERSDQDSGGAMRQNPLAEALVTSGASTAVVERLLTRFASESGKPMTDRPSAVSWLADNLQASNCDWDGFYGCHAFMGESGVGCTSLVLAAAARLQKMGRRTLVLSLFPNHSGKVRQLQVAASEHGYDAAVIQKEGQLARSETHLTRYEVVLLDLPSVDHPALAEGGALHRWLALNSGFHRHLVVGLDRDLQDIEELQTVARSWNCDWVAVSRTDRTRRPGKLLDLVEGVPLPISLTSANPAAGGDLNIAASGALLDLILAAAGREHDTQAEADSA